MCRQWLAWSCQCLGSIHKAKVYFSVSGNWGTVTGAGWKRFAHGCRESVAQPETKVRASVFPPNILGGKHSPWPCRCLITVTLTHWTTESPLRLHMMQSTVSFPPEITEPKQWNICEWMSRRLCPWWTHCFNKSTLFWNLNHLYLTVILQSLWSKGCSQWTAQWWHS